MDAQELTLNIAVNMGRLCRWAMSGNRERIDQFLNDTQIYVDLLDKAPKRQEFIETYTIFRKKFDNLKTDVRLDDIWAEDALTWANILTHRAKLA